MKKLKRISAALMVILLAGLFIAAIVLAITGAPANQLMAVIVLCYGTDDTGVKKR